MDAGESERFRMPMTVETDGSEAFVGGAVYRSGLGRVSCDKDWVQMYRRSLMCVCEQTYTLIHV